MDKFKVHGCCYARFGYTHQHLIDMPTLGSNCIAVVQSIDGENIDGFNLMLS